MPRQSLPPCLHRSFWVGWTIRRLNSMIQERGLDVPEDIFRAEGYLLDIRPEGILLAGYDPAGAFYSVQSFIQILHQAAPATAEAKEFINPPSMTVFDWPNKPVRGLHIYMPGREQIPYFKELLGWLSSLNLTLCLSKQAGAWNTIATQRSIQPGKNSAETARQYPGGGYEMERTQPFVKMSSHVEFPRSGASDRPALDRAWAGR